MGFQVVRTTLGSAMAMSSIKLSTATGLSADSDKQCLDNYYITSLMLHVTSIVVETKLHVVAHVTVQKLTFRGV